MPKTTCHPELVSGSVGFKIPTFVGMTMLVVFTLFITPAFAEDKKWNVVLSYES